MAEVKKARLFLRRGTDTDRQTTTLCQGELGYSTDAFRVFVGDGTTVGGRSLGMTAFVSAGVNFNTDLTEASASGQAHVGDIAVFPSSNWTNAGGGTSSINSTHATTVMLLTGANPATATHWVNINNNIPFGNISVSADDISGTYVSGGIISGPITISGGNVNIGGDGTSENVFLSGVALSAQDADELTGTIIYPIGITASSQITAVSSIYELGIKTVGSGHNNAGYLSAGRTSSTVISAYSQSTTAIAKSTLGTLGTLRTPSKNIFTEYLFDNAMTGGASGNTDLNSVPFIPAAWDTTWDTDGEQVQYAGIKYTLANINTCLGVTLTWDVIEEFQFSFYSMIGEGKAGFFGYYNALIDSNVPLEFITTNAKSKKINTGPNLSLVSIPNTYVNGTEELVVHIGNEPDGFAGFVLTGVKIRL